MSGVFGKIFNRNKREFKPPFKLKAYNAKTGEWEDIDEFDQPVRLSEIKDLIEELKEDGYTRFRLEDSKGQKVWVRYYKAVERALTERNLSEIEKLADLFAKYVELNTKILENLSKLRQEPKIDPNELLASNIAFIQTIRNLCREVPWICGVEKTASLEDMIMSLLFNMLLQQRLQPTPTAVQQPATQALQQAIQQTPPPINPSLLAPPTPEAAEVVNRAVMKALEETEKMWVTECKVMNTCVEGEAE
jgi:hypothetical protein